MVHDLTDQFRGVVWVGKPSQDLTSFQENIRRIRRGVYVHYLVNDHPHPVHDRNGERIGRGKRLILPNLATIKFGKFEDGLIQRRSLDALHMHRRDPLNPLSTWPLTPQTFAECLKLALVLDLGERTKVEIRTAERHLRTQMRGFLQTHQVSVQDHKGDYRLLTSTPPTGLQEKLAEWARHEFAQILHP